MGEMKWYVVQAYSGYENKVKLALEERIKQEGLESLFGEILIPKENVQETRAGKKRVALAVSVAKTKNFDLYEGLDISHVLAEFSTVYALTTKYKDRTHNLKVGAAKLDGYVLRPGELLSYNKVVGPRNKAQGYRTAPVITAGELVDGMAGGSCQLSSTLFAAAFFAGLSLESSRPHTIPSGYIKMGLGE